MRETGKDPQGDAGEPAHGSASSLEQNALTRPSSRRLVWIAVRVAGSVAALVTVYYLVPLDRSSTAGAVTKLLIGLAGFIALVVFQIRLIINSSQPGAQAAEALATSVPFFLLLFAATYVSLASVAPDSFGEHLSHSDGLYFTVTVFSTVGFGDIVAKTEAARLVVTTQMLADLIILGLGVKVIVGAVRHSRQHAARLSK